MGFGATGEVQDSVHDAVEVIHLLAHDADIGLAGITRTEVQVERVVKHLHHRQWIADLMGNFGSQESQGTEAFALAEGLFDGDDAVVEAGFFESQGRQFGIGRKSSDFFVREEMRLARVNV